jgi:hypothetical protein
MTRNQWLVTFALVGILAVVAWVRVGSFGLRAARAVANQGAPR